MLYTLKYLKLTAKHLTEISCAKWLSASLLQSKSVFHHVTLRNI